MVRSRGLEPPRVSPLAPQASASTNSATTACGEECRETRLQATAQHVTNRMCADKGGLSGGPFHGFTGLPVTPPSRPSRQSEGRSGEIRPPHRMSGRRGSICLTSTAMRLWLTTTAPVATGMSSASILTFVVLARVELDDGAAAEPEHLVHRHGRRAPADMTRLVNEWLTCATPLPAA